tara:strand:- start:779 stop:1258 length:480 start_codon:yes stop_codon:yes gene_type:complete
MSKSVAPTLEFIDVHGNAGQVTRTWHWPFTPESNQALNKARVQEYRCRWYAIWKDSKGSWWLSAHIGCMWDYATGYWDGDYIKEASLGHDILHWLIALGILPTSMNDLIDREFKAILIERGDIAHWRANILMRGVNLVDQKQTGIDRPVIKLHKGKRVK